MNSIYFSQYPINPLSVNDVSRPKFSVQNSALTSYAIFQIEDISQSEFHQLHKRKKRYFSLLYFFFN